MSLARLWPGRFLVFVVFALLAGCQSAPEQTFFEKHPIIKGDYDYPLESARAATVVGTPKDYGVRLPKGYRVRRIMLDVFPGREIPEVFWYAKRLRVSAALQEGPAPLVFSIAGTGADDRSETMQVIEALLYGQGFHVISVASPTHPNFIVGGSRSSVPGRVEEDVEDLYRVMRLAYERVAPEIEVTEFHLTGYSLGGWHAAFLAKLDSEVKAFDFSRVLLLNPPESLFESISILDGLLDESLPNGVESIEAFIDEAFDAFSELYQQADFAEFDEDFLYRAYSHLDPSEEKLGAAIGLAFRISANNMIFTADVMNGGGFIVPENARLTTRTSLTPYLKVGARTGFADYLEKFYCPYYLAKNPELTHEDLVSEASLKTIAPFLSQSPNIGLIHNADDVILGSDDLAFFKETFAQRALILPNGGHLGNLGHRYVLASIASFFKGEEWK